jgi:catechol 2,3-dioxygenase-like lactoylglutathione lyase family enzyme
MALKPALRRAAPAAAFVLSAILCAGLAGAVLAQTPAAPTPTPQSRGPQAPAVEPLIKDAHFHHIHMNSTDPAAAIEFYVKHFKSQKARFAGLTDAVWAQRAWLLFTKVNTPPDKRLNAGIWHIGWGSTDPRADYARQQSLGAKFFAELSDASELVGAPAGSGRIMAMYIEGPDRQLIELNTDPDTNFGHMHLLSADPLAAGDWYIKMFGMRGQLTTPQTSREPRFFRGRQNYPSKNLTFDNMSILIYPQQYAMTDYPDDWKGVTELQPTRGKVNDHFGVSVPNLDEAIAKLKGAGVKVTAEPRSIGDGKVRFAFIEGPDKVAIEVMEDKSEHPPYS